MWKVTFSLVAVSASGASVSSGGCSDTSPPVWPKQFKVVQRKIPRADPTCAGGGCSHVTTYYDWERKANLIIDTPDTKSGKGTLWDLELGNGRSYYIHPAVHQCAFVEMPVGILRPDWLINASYTGKSTINGKPVYGWTKLDFIDYYADVEDCSPVKWYFHKMKASFVTLGFFEGAAAEASFFKPPAYCPNTTDTSEKEGTNLHISGSRHVIERMELSMFLCQDHGLTINCKQYHMPVDACYNPTQLFPEDPQWGSSDLKDVVNGTHLRRSFFATGNGTCGQRTDGFELPLGVAIGPFGAPRPWGRFDLESDLGKTSEAALLI